ncbi:MULTISPECIES: hypothetical protein [Pseudomonas]|uniref:hypothetical protein n=1 Tax=Pseudomonas TaxID=286 RepID=UPI0012E09241|nr:MULTISPECIES: hypothetical protein [Pseudomonas]
MNERTLRCEFCGSQDIGAFVQHGSYFTRCLSCGQDGWATSWLALSSQIVEAIRAVSVDEQQNTIEVLAEGAGEAITSAISRAAYEGKLIRLFIGGSDA